MNEWNPQWTDLGSWTLGRDPLGMQATSVRLYRSLVPGLTNVTNRLRYYSFYCWVVELFERTKHADDPASWAVCIRRAEALYAIASQMHDPNGAQGLGGGIWAAARRRELNEGKMRKFDFRKWTDRRGEPGAPRQYLDAKNGNFGQFYTASMLEVGLLARSRGVPLVSDERGKAAAKAFEQSISNTVSLLESGIREGEIETDDLEALGKAIHPSNIPPQSTEMQILRAFLLDENGEWSGAKRRASARLVLDVMRHMDGEFVPDALRGVFYNRVLPDGSPYESDDADTLDRWQAYQANELCHIALAAFLNGLVHRLDREGGEAEPGPLVEGLVDSVFSSLGGDGSWSKWAGNAGAEWEGREDELAAAVLETIGDKEKAGSLRGMEAAARLLATLWRRWRQAPNSVERQITKTAGVDIPSVVIVLATLADSGAERRGAALAKVISRHVIANHMAIAGRKLAASGTFTYHFTMADGRIADGERGEYGYTNPRLGNLLVFLGDAGLHDGGVPTADGIKFLDGR
jgi:hypothetical protein